MGFRCLCGSRWKDDPPASYLTTGKVTALDLYDHKLKLIQENANRLHVADKILTKKLDATKVFETFGLMLSIKFCGCALFRDWFDTEKA